MAIQLSDYNNLQASVALIIGKGSTTYGYGQAIVSSQLTGTAAAPNTIKSSEWTKLRSDLVTAVLYQNGGNTTGLTTALPIVAANTLITSAILTKYQNAVTSITTNRNPVIVPSSPDNQGTRVTLTNNGTYSNWDNLITEVRTIQFASGSKTSGSGTYAYTAEDAARFYFNTGSIVEFSATLTGSSNTSKDTSWINLFSAMGTVRFGLNATTRTGTGTGAVTTNLGYTDLTTNDQVVFTQYAEAGTYGTNFYQLKVRKTGVAGQLVFTVVFNDATGALNPPVGVDEMITGTTTSICQTLRATGYVSVPAPTGAMTSSTITNSPTFSMSVTPSIVSQGGRQTFSVLTTNIVNSPATTLYWTTDLATSSSKFQDGQTQGTVTVSNNTASFYRDTAIDYALTSTSYTISIRTGSYTGPVMCYATATIKEAIPSYSISPSKTTMTENNDTVVFTVSTTAVPDGTSLFWKTNAVAGQYSIDSPDFDSSFPTSYITINSTAATISLTTVPDFITEGTEAFTISIHLTPSSPALATSAPVYISDTSISGGGLSVNKTSVRMGDTATFTATVQGYTSGTTLYWGLSGTAAPSRSVGSVTTGSFTVSGSTSSATGTFNVTIATDTAIHPVETFSAQLYTDAARTSPLGSPAGPVTISLSGTLYYGASSSFSVPSGVKQIIVNGVGGGGGSSGFHQNKGYGSVCEPGGPGGGVANYTTTVNTNDNCTFTIGAGGGPGYYVKGGWGTGHSGSATTFAINGAQRFIANAGGNAGDSTTGGAGGGTINVPGTAGSVLSGSRGSAIGGTTASIYDVCGTNYNAAGIPPIACPAQIPGPPSSDVRGRAERAGWLTITYS